MVPDMAIILFFSRDYGGILTFLPVIKEFEKGDSENEILIISHALSKVLYQREQINTKPIQMSNELDNAEQFLNELLLGKRPDLIVTGTSRLVKNEIRTLEQILIKLAKDLNIKTLSILDFWGFYQERFPSINGCINNAYLPDIICALDKHCTSELVNIGIPEDNIHNTHNPHVDQLLERSLVEGQGNNRKQGELVLLYVSQPIRENIICTGLDFDQESNFNYLMKALQNKFLKNKKITIYLWIHPKENIANWDDIIVRNNLELQRGMANIQLIKDEEKTYDLFPQLDLVCSCFSTIIYDALYYNIPCLSLAIGGGNEMKSVLVTNELGLSTFISNWSDLVKFLSTSDWPQLRDELTERISRYRAENIFFSDGQATKRVVSLINKQLSDK